MRAAVRLRHILQLSEGNGEPRSDIVAERDSAQKTRAVDSEFFAGRERGWNHGAARMRLGGRMGIVGLVGMSQKTVGKRRFNRAAQDLRTRDRADFLAAIGSRELNGKAARR